MPEPPERGRTEDGDLVARTGDDEGLWLLTIGYDGVGFIRDVAGIECTC